MVNENQQFKFASELISEIREKTEGSEKLVTIFAAGYPECSFEELQNLKKKIDIGVDIVLTQVVFSADKFIEFLRNCREIGISTKVFIIPGMYVPYNWTELGNVLRISKVSLEGEIYEKFHELKDDDEGFKTYALDLTTKMIREIQQRTPEFIRGFHFFTMNNFEMVERLIKIVNFSEEK